MIDLFTDKDLFLNEIGRKVLKVPMGVALYKEIPESIDIFEELVELCDPHIVISVGDIVTHNLLRYNKPPNIAIIDGKTLRYYRYHIDDFFLKKFNTVVYCHNPKGTITYDCVKRIKDVIEESLRKDNRILLMVEGEEDLLVIPSIIFSPKKSFIVYGHWKGSLNILIVNDYLKRCAFYSIRKFFK